MKRQSNMTVMMTQARYWETWFLRLVLTWWKFWDNGTVCLVSFSEWSFQSWPPFCYLLFPISVGFRKAPVLVLFLNVQSRQLGIEYEPCKGLYSIFEILKMVHIWKTNQFDCVHISWCNNWKICLGRKVFWYEYKSS